MTTRIGFRSYIPKKLFDIPAGTRAKEQALDAMAEEAVGLFENTIATWNDKPEIRVQSTTNTRQVRVLGKIYEYIDKGTRPHIIRPKRARYLSFLSGYRAKTRPGVIGSSGGGKGGSQVFAKIVHHPGTTPRNFSEIIRERVQKHFVARMKQALMAYISNGEAPGI